MAHKKRQNRKAKKESPKTVHGILTQNLHFLAIYTLVLVVLVGNLSVFGTPSEEIQKAPDAQMVLSMHDRQIVPQLKPREFLSFPALSAYGGLVIDVDTGKTLFEKNADYPMLPASTVKMMTALVALEEYDLGDVVTYDGSFVEGQKLGLTEGENIYVHDLVASTLIYSANDAAEALARAHPLGRETFIELMNQKARVLGLTTISFVNPTGLDSINQIASANELAMIAKEGLKNDYFSSFIEREEYSFENVDGTRTHQISNTNQLLGQIDGVKGVKTGWTENAQENLVTYVERDDKRILTVLLGSQNRFGETKTLIEWIYDNYEWSTYPSYLSNR